MLGKKFKVYLYNCYFCLYDNFEYELLPSYLLPFCPALFGTLLLRDKCSKESSNPNSENYIPLNYLADTESNHLSFSQT